VVVLPPAPEDWRYPETWGVDPDEGHAAMREGDPPPPPPRSAETQMSARPWKKARSRRRRKQ